MRSNEQYLDANSEFFNFVPSVQGKSVFFYPISTGHFLYKPGYSLERNSYDSFLIMYILNGSAKIETKNFSGTACEKDFVFLNCYEYHKYSTENGYDCLWLHFDGISAAGCYHMVTARMGNIFHIHGSRPIADKMYEILHMFSSGNQISEPYLSKLITDILTGFLMSENKTSKRSRFDVSMENILSYINEHFREALTIDDLASAAGLSPYHFIRTFKQSTGYTPHEYLLDTRIENAKYLLTTTSMTSKDICFETGFSSESVFCASFRKKTGLTPSDYRSQTLMHRS